VSERNLNNIKRNVGIHKILRIRPPENAEIESESNIRADVIFQFTGVLVAHGANAAMKGGMFRGYSMLSEVLRIHSTIQKWDNRILQCRSVIQPA